MTQISPSRLALAVLVAFLSRPALAGTISGTVVAKTTNAALPGITVEAYGSAGALAARATTGATGTYSLTLASGTYKIIAYDNFAIYATSFYDGASSFDTATELTLSTSGSLTANFALERAGRIAGKVTSASGVAIAGAIVEVYNVDGSRRARATTISTGEFIVPVAPGTYKVVAYDDTLTYGFEFFNEKSSFEGAAVVEVKADLTTRNVNFSLPLTATLSGRVRDSSGASLSGMRVVAYDSLGRVLASADTDAAGAFSFKVTPVALRVAAYDPAGVYAVAYYGGTSSFEASPVVNPSAGGQLAGFELTLVGAGYVAGLIRDESTGLPLTNITIAAYNSDGSRRAFTTTDGAGHYRLVLPPGVYRIAAFDVQLRYALEFHDSSVDFSAARELIVLETQTVAINFDVARYARLSGVVTGASGSPLAGMRVAAHALDRTAPVATTVTNSEGAFELLVPGGSYRIAVYDEALVLGKMFYGPSLSFGSATTIHITPGESRDALNVQLAPVGVLRATMRSKATGLPLAGSLYVFDMEGYLVELRATDASGAVEIRLSPGSYKIAFADPNGRHATLFFDASPSFSNASTVVIASGQLVTVSGSLEERRLVRRRPVRRG